MRRADLITAALLMLVGGIVVYDAVRLGIGWGTDGPSSGFFPFWLGTGLIVTCGIIFLRAALGGVSGAFASRAQLRSVLTVLAPATGAVALMGFVGLYVASGLYLTVSMRWLGRHGWPMVAMVALGVPLITYVVFERWFLLPLPKGWLEAWLGL